jgi:hypothetical protein
MNLILDMDNTLIYLQTSRPYLEYFLEEAFLNFKNVSIWTAANIEWFNHINTLIFIPIIENINKKHNKKYKFDFVFDSKKCSPAKNFDDFQIIYEKRLRKLHRSKKHSDYTMDNTLIVDDNITTFRKNYGNAIHISSFYSFMDKDKELLKLVQYLKKEVIPHYEKFKTIRNLEKRCWYFLDF